MTNNVDGLAALATFRSYSNLVPRHCLEYVWDAYHAHGAQSSVNYATAADALKATPGMHAGDYNPPAGKPVWFDNDVAISAGGGQVVAVWNTGVHQVSIQQRADEIGEHYHGWTDYFMTDNLIVTPPAALVVDGVLGRETITRWQQVMGSAVDGTISTPSELVGRVQSRLNAAGARDWDGRSLVVDGLGIAQNGQKTRTVWALQAYLGTPRDGILSTPASTVIKALQNRLNAGTF
jgi:hypothetical protein